jgi:Cytochrome c oxidase subunit IV
VSLYARLALGLAAFLLVVGIVYGITGHEYTGMLLLLVTSACFAFIGVFVRRTVRDAARAAAAGGAEVEVEEPHVGPTIWPFVLPLGALFLVLGAIVTPWLLILGAVGLAVAGAGWFRDVGRQWHHAGD